MFEGSQLHWTEYLGALGPLLISCIVAYIAYQQWKTNKDSLREKLFDRRMSVYELVLQFYTEMLRSAKCDDDNLCFISEAYKASAFLFDKDTRKKIEKFRALGVNLQYYNKMIQSRPDDPKKSQWIEKETEILKSLPEEFEKVFLSFEKSLAFPY